MKQQKVNPVRKVVYCAHCGNTAPQRLLHTQKYFERSWTTATGEEEPHPWAMFVAVCETCGQLSLYDNPGDQLEEDRFFLGELAFPKAGQLHASVPTFVSEIYLEAFRIREIAPNAFAVQIRRALEALCEDRSAKGRNLADKLKDLSMRGEIPKVLAEVTDVLRLIGNIGAHAVGKSVHPLQAYAIDDFFRAVVEYVYVAPAKLREFKERMEQSKQRLDDA